MYDWFINLFLKHKIMSTTNVNIVLFGKGNVGSTLINQIIDLQKKENNKTNLTIIAIANSTKALINFNGIEGNWEQDFNQFSENYQPEKLISEIVASGLENLVAVDVTASQEILNYYDLLIKSGFHLVAANKKANANTLDFYQNLRKKLNKHNKQFFYETNVGAGLPIIEPIKNLVAAGEKITKINGVFSGTLSYVFNRFATQNISFSEIVTQAKRNGLTEPNPIEDLEGTDVARKLLILAREIGVEKELQDVQVNAFLPKDITESDLPSLDADFHNLKLTQKEGHVLKYIGELDVEKNTLSIGLQAVDKNSPIGQLSGADNIIQIFSENYNQNPIVIQGAGAGKEVTARGVLGDIIRLANSLTNLKNKEKSVFYEEKIA
jgi:bifunctional aspartokinase / homoserine dehydrogenase 1